VISVESFAVTLIHCEHVGIQEIVAFFVLFFYVTFSLNLKREFLFQYGC